MRYKRCFKLYTKTLYEKLDKSKPVAITFLDLAKAFDTVNHEILLKKLYNYGIRGKAHNLISNYLCNRKQKVRIGTIESSYEKLNTGVPQGTILGPFLFIVYVNDLLVSRSDTTILHADDTAIIASEDSWEEVEIKMNMYLKDTAIWLALNKLSLNVQKTVFITFGNYCDSLPEDLNIKIQSTKLVRVEYCKYLGIIINCNLKWDKQVEYLIKKTKYMIYILYKMSQYMTTETLRMIYYTLLHSIISYSNIARGGAYNNVLDLLQRIQTRILKIVNKNNFYQENPLNIKQIFAYECVTYHYNDLKNIYLNSKRVTRKKLIIPPKCSKMVSNKNNYIKAIQVYNNLPTEEKTLKMLDISKNYNKNKIKNGVSINIFI